MKNQSVPFIAIGNDELRGQANAVEGELTTCPRCSGKHPVEFATDAKTGEKTNMLGFVSCGKDSFLVAVGGKLL
jgi:hypothetical protein